MVCTGESGGENFQKIVGGGGGGSFAGEKTVHVKGTTVGFFETEKRSE